MKKLLINALLVLGFAAVVLGFVLGLSRLRAVDETEVAIDTMLETENQAAAYAVEKEILDQSKVTVTVTTAEENTSEEENKTTTTKTTTPSSDDALVSGFLEKLEK
jgi:hypothetical protein